MIEDVEEVFERFVVVRLTLENQFCAGNVECAETACETEEVDGHLGRRFRLFPFRNVFPAFDLSDVTRREIEFDDGSKVNDLLRWIRALSWWKESFPTHSFITEGVNDLEQANGLEKVKPVSFGEEPVFNRRLFSPTVVVYSRTVWPAIGSHCFQIPSRCLLLTIS